MAAVEAHIERINAFENEKGKKQYDKEYDKNQVVTFHGRAISFFAKIEG